MDAESGRNIRFRKKSRKLSRWRSRLFKGRRTSCRTTTTTSCIVYTRININIEDVDDPEIVGKGVEEQVLGGFRQQHLHPATPPHSSRRRRRRRRHDYSRHGIIAGLCEHIRRPKIDVGGCRGRKLGPQGGWSKSKGTVGHLSISKGLRQILTQIDLIPLTKKIRLSELPIIVSRCTPDFVRLRSCC